MIRTALTDMNCFDKPECGWHNWNDSLQQSELGSIIGRNRGFCEHRVF